MLATPMMQPAMIPAMAPYNAGAVAGIVVGCIVVLITVAILMLVTFVTINSNVFLLPTPLILPCSPSRHRNGKKSKRIRQRKKESRAEERTDRL